MRLSGIRLVGLLILLPISLLFLWWHFLVARELVRQSQSEHYPSVAGIITHSRVQQRSGSKNSTSYFFVVQYTYEVDGKKYEGTRNRYLPQLFSEPEPVVLLTKRFPQNSTAQVFYRPEDPADSLLSPGVIGEDVLAPMFPGLFTLMVLLGWVAALSRHDPRHVPEFERNGRIHVTMAALPPIYPGLFGAGLVLVIGNTVRSGGSTLSIGAALGMWAAVGLLGVGGWLAQWLRLRWGVKDVILDERASQLSLPATIGLNERLEVPLKQIVTISIERMGERKQSYRPVLEFVDPRRGNCRAPIGPWLVDPARAQSLANALKVRLRLHERRARAEGSG